MMVILFQGGAPKKKKKKRQIQEERNKQKKNQKKKKRMPKKFDEFRLRYGQLLSNVFVRWQRFDLRFRFKRPIARVT